jgi:hypothetical protein
VARRHDRLEESFVMRRTWIKYLAAAALLTLIVVQFVQPDRFTPPVNPAAAFESVARPSAELAAVVARACRDCHSYETVWPWYGRVAPVSWLVANDVQAGRAHLNFSEWSFLSPEMSRAKLSQACQEVRRGDMPLWQYKLMHPAARLSAADIESFCTGAGTAPYAH